MNHLNRDQAQAILKYANDNGRNWKSALRRDWETGKSFGELQQIRNEFGPTWLRNLRINALHVS